IIRVPTWNWPRWTWIQARPQSWTDRSASPSLWNDFGMSVSSASRAVPDASARADHPAAPPAVASPLVTLCVLTYGDYPDLIERALTSIQTHFPRSAYRLVVGANAPGEKTSAYLNQLQDAGAIDTLIAHPINLNKCPMMRLMFERVTTEYIWWFDDDSYVTSPH